MEKAPFRGERGQEWGERGPDLTPRYGGVTQRKPGIIDLTYIYILHKDSESFS